MNESPSGTGSQRASREEMRSALFAQLVVQQTNMALMLLGQVPHPETGETVRDLRRTGGRRRTGGMEKGGEDRAEPWEKRVERGRTGGVGTGDCVCPRKSHGSP